MKRYKIFLNGKQQDSETHLTVVDPATNEPFAEVATLNRERLKKAIEDAHGSFSEWKSLTAKERGEYLRAIAAELEKRFDQMAELIARENGKPLAQAKGEVTMSIDHLLWFAEESVMPFQMPG